MSPTREERLPLLSSTDKSPMSTRFSPNFRRAFVYWVVPFLLGTFFVLGIVNHRLDGKLAALSGIVGLYNVEEFSSSDEMVFEEWHNPKMPDFGQYVKLRSISDVELHLPTGGKRLIVVGDIHGSIKPLNTLLSKLSYSPSSDLLIHLGDVVAKGPSSIAVLEKLSSQNITGVRGNHDQEVIEWRGFINWVGSFKGGLTWLKRMEHMSAQEIESESKKANTRLRIPKGWDIHGMHYAVAKKMTEAQYEYLLRLPLAIHIPALHAHFVHAGMLPIDPTRSRYSLHQPLSHIPKHLPTAHHGAAPDALKPEPRIRLAQELALLTRIPQNNDPFTLMNMRSVLKNGKVTRKVREGTPWSKIWEREMKQCGGFDVKASEESEGVEANHHKKLPCKPSTVVYGHAASRGLHVKRWSVGVDTGCVYGRRLTALVIDPPTSTNTTPPLYSDLEADEEVEVQSVPFGDNGSAWAVSVKC